MKVRAIAQQYESTQTTRRNIPTGAVFFVLCGHCDIMRTEVISGNEGQSYRTAIRVDADHLGRISRQALFLRALWTVGHHERTQAVPRSDIHSYDTTIRVDADH